MKKIKRTAPIILAEQNYWTAYHYLQVCMADKDATLSDRRECLADVKTKFDALVKACTKQYYAQHREKIPKAKADAWVSEYIADNLRITSDKRKKA